MNCKGNMIACIPVKDREMFEQVVGAKMPDGRLIEKCQLCDGEIYVGPEQVAVRRDGDDTLCLNCAASIAKAIKIRGGLAEVRVAGRGDITEL